MPDFALVAGVPAKIIGWMCECGVKIKFSGKKGTCPACRKKYLKDSASSLKAFVILSAAKNAVYKSNQKRYNNLEVKNERISISNKD